MSADAEAPTTAEQLAAALSEDKPTPDQAPSPETSATAQTTEPEYFSENFDPSSLPDELQPAYKQMQGAWTRKTQELAEQRKQAQWQADLVADLQSDDPAAKQGALEWMAQNGLLTEEQVAQVFGYEFDDQTETDEDQPDPLAALRAEIDQLKSERDSEKQQSAQEALVARVDEHIGSELAGIAKDLGLSELPKRTADLIVSRALVAYTDPRTGFPDVKAAFQEYQADMDERARGWASTKETTHTPTGGLEATEQPDLDDPQVRRNVMADGLAVLRDRAV